MKHSLFTYSMKTCGFISDQGFTVLEFVSKEINESKALADLKNQIMFYGIPGIIPDLDTFKKLGRN